MADGATWRLGEELREPFRVRRRTSRGILAAFVVINLVTLTAGMVHHPYMMYDGWGHILYFRSLAKGVWPTREITGEFFSPPLPYVVPATLEACHLPEVVVFKGTHLVQVLAAMTLTFFLLRIGRRVSPDRALPRVLSLVLLGMIPAYHRAFAFIRGEPWVALWTVMLADVLLVTVAERRLGVRRAIGVGVLCGLAVLSRQWGLFSVMAAAIFALLACWRLSLPAWESIRFAAVAGLIAVVLGAPFYIYLKVDYGRFTSFNRQPRADTRDWSFYLWPKAEKLFTAPVSPNLMGSAPGVFYAETWGDYWEYWNVYGRDARGRYLNDISWPENDPPAATNLDSAAPYLGRVMILALLPTLLLALGCVYAFREAARSLRGNSPGERQVLGLFTAVLGVVTMAGFGAFVVSMWSPFNNADHVKGTYVMHLFPLAALWAGLLIGRLRDRMPRATVGLMAALAIVALHNAGTLVSWYLPPWYGFLPR